MTANHFECVSRWRVRGAVDEVFDVLLDAPSLPAWWPAVHRDVLEIQSGDPDRAMKVVRFETRGLLPYTLNWHATVTRSDPPRGFDIKAWGDIEGTGEWTLEQNAGFVEVAVRWRIEGRKPLLRYGSPLLRPLFALDFRWAMKTGEESLALELRRRRAATAAERAAVSPPPVAAPGIAPGVLAAAGLLAMMFAGARLRRRRRGNARARGRSGRVRRVV